MQQNKPIYAKGFTLYNRKNSLGFYICSNDNRAHVHVGKQGVDKFCKIWLEPAVTLEKQGDLTDKQTKQVLQLTETHREKLLKQWTKFKAGETIKIITVKN